MPEENIVFRKIPRALGSGRMHDSEGTIVSVAPPQIEMIGVRSEMRCSWLVEYMSSIRLSKRAGGRVCGVDIVMMAEISGEGRRDVETTPPIECPMTTMDVFGGYNERI